jgi:hypothetical protein
VAFMPTTRPAAAQHFLARSGKDVGVLGDVTIPPLAVVAASHQRLVAEPHRRERDFFEGISNASSHTPTRREHDLTRTPAGRLDDDRPIDAQDIW